MHIVVAETDGVLGSGSPPCCSNSGGGLLLGGGGPGWRAVLCLSLSHSLQVTLIGQFLAWWLIDAQHLKHMFLSFKYAFLSSRGLQRKLRHFLRGWGFLCSGHCLSGSSLTSVVFVSCANVCLSDCYC